MPCWLRFVVACLPADASARSKESIEKMENIKSVELSWRQLAEHNKEGDAWLAIRGQVYDVTSWVNAHPGGKDTILLNAVRAHLLTLNIHSPKSQSAHKITQIKFRLRNRVPAPIYTSIVWAS